MLLGEPQGVGGVASLAGCVIWEFGVKLDGWGKKDEHEWNMGAFQITRVAC